MALPILPLQQTIADPKNGQLNDQWVQWLNLALVQINSGIQNFAPIASTYIIRTPDSMLSSSFALSTLSSGFLKVTTGTGNLTATATIAASFVTGLAPSATTDTTNASNITSGTLPAAQLPNPTASTLGGIESLASVSSKWINQISTSGVPSATQPTDADISFSDITTNNSSTSNHGYLKKLDNNAAHYQDGTGNWSTPSGTSFCVQQVRTNYITMTTGTTTVPLDDTIPQNTEGDQYFTVSITPTNSSNKLVIEANVNGSHSAVGQNVETLAIYQDSTANALAVGWEDTIGAAQIFQISCNFSMTAGTTSATTFKVRVGCNAAGTTTINGAGGARYYGGVMTSYIQVTEYSS